MLRRLAAALMAVVATALPIPAQDAPPKPPEGRFALTVGNDGRAEKLYLLALGVEGGKMSAKVVGVAPKQSTPTLGPPTFEGGVLRFLLTRNGNRFELEVRADPKQPSRYLGSLATNSRAFRATLEPTTLDALTVADTVVPTAPSELGAAIAKLRGGETVLRRLADALPNAEEGKRLAREADAVAKANAPAIDKLRRKLALAGEGAASNQAVRDLLAGAAAADASPADVAAWVGAVTAEAAPYGPKVVAQAREDLARPYAHRAGCGNVAVGFALEAAADPSISKRVRVAAFRELARAQLKAGLDADAAATTKRVAALDAELDAESRKAVPFSPAKYAGRVNKAANRVAVMELFTGAECPTCVAADVAFDALIARYEPADAVFLQYHLHIPRPDPLASPDGVARLLYHLEWHKEAIRDYPAPAFNGKPAAGGGGGLAQAEAKHAEFARLLDKTLEGTTAVGVRGGVTRSGDDLTVAVELTGTKGLGDKAVLRLVLAEDAVKYAGGNGRRVHRHVVRSLLGTGEGVKVAGLKSGQYTTTRSLKELRDELTDYMQTWGGPGREFVFAERPLELKGLKVVALVQDDATGEVAQTAQFDVPE